MIFRIIIPIDKERNKGAGHMSKWGYENKNFLFSYIENSLFLSLYNIYKPFQYVFKDSKYNTRSEIEAELHGVFNKYYFILRMISNII